MTFLPTELLDSLKVAVEERMQTHQLHMAKGLPEKEYWEAVGRHKECRHLIELITTTKEDNDGDDEDKPGGKGQRGKPAST